MQTSKRTAAIMKAREIFARLSDKNPNVVMLQKLFDLRVDVEEMFREEHIRKNTNGGNPPV